jgi:glycosyltransferase involved in cell wall biosynthesis
MVVHDIRSTVIRESRPSQASADRPEVTVVIPVRNDPINLTACLSALKASAGVRYEVVVVDDASTDDTSDVARSHGARVVSLSQNVGPAIARNQGCQAARGEFVVFLDADVCATPHTLEQFVQTFRSQPHVAAAFGSYDTRPTRTNLVSQYKNLVHHYVHQQGKSEASTFWSGCGAVRRDAFIELDGFHAGYGRPCIEDIEFGSRLRETGERIWLNKDIQVTHRKHWSLPGMIKADVFDRAVPWTRLILRSNQMPNDLNLRTSQRFSAALSCVLVVLVALATWYRPWIGLLPISLLALLWTLDRFSLTTPTRASESYALAGLALLVAMGLWGVVLWPVLGVVLAVPLLMLGAIVAINHDLFAFFLRERGPWFAFLMVPLHVLYFLYSSATFAIVVLAHKLGIGREAL